MSTETELAAVKEQLRGLRERLDEVHHAVIGNGSPGLKVQVDRHDQQLALINRVVLMVAAPSMIAIIGAIGWLITKVVHS